MKFYLGTHMDGWVGHAGFPLFVSHMRLRKRKKLPRAIAPWALDSGGFTQLSQYGEWVTTARDYAAAVRRYRDEIGQLEWAAPQDWMCEPSIIERTGLSVTEHHRRTLTNGLELRMIDDTLPWKWVVQGWDPEDYLRHRDMHEAAGIDLAAEPLVGIGTVCRRQDTGQADWIIRSLAPIRLHGFGVKTTGLTRFGHRLTSADSMAWSYNARRNPPMAGCTHKSCANCLRRATWWRQALLAKLAAAEAAGRQGDLFDQDNNWRRTA